MSGILVASGGAAAGIFFLTRKQKSDEEDDPWASVEAEAKRQRAAGAGSQNEFDDDDDASSERGRLAAHRRLMVLACAAPGLARRGRFKHATGGASAMVGVDPLLRIAGAGAVEQRAGGLLSDRAELSNEGDQIFAWHARWLKAHMAGRPAINGTLGLLLDDEGELVVHDSVSRALTAVPAVRASAYAPLAGVPAFRRLAIDLALGDTAAPLSALGISTAAMATPGGLGALSLSARNLTDARSQALIEAPHWVPYRLVLSQADLGWRAWPRIGADGTVDVPALRALIDELGSRQHHVLMWLNDPAHNPSGHSLSADDRAALLDVFVEAAERRPEVGHTLLLDQAYAAYAAEPHGCGRTVLALAGSGRWPPNLLLAWAVSCSKSHTLYGMRCGALVVAHPRAHVAEQIIQACGTSARGLWSGAPALPQWAVSSLHTDPTLLAQWQTEVAAVRTLLTDRHQQLLDGAARRGLALMDGHDGYFAHLPHPEPSEVVARAAEQDVFLVPLGDGVRVGVCAVATGQVARVADALADAVAQV